MKLQDYLRPGLAGTLFLSLSLVACGGGGVTPGAKPDPEPAALVSVAVTPSDITLNKGGNQQFKATGTYSNGTSKDVTASATWSATPAGEATVGNATGNKGLVQAIAIGESTVVASVASGASGASVSGHAQVSVQAPALTSISISPATASVALGNKQLMTATGTYSDATTSDITATATWTSSDLTVASVNRGQVTTLKQGATTISATSGSLSGRSKLAVSPAALVSIAVGPSNPSIAKGGKQQFTATGTYTDGSTQNLTGSVIWSVSGGGTITNAGLVTGVSPGSLSVTAQSESTTGTASALVSSATLAAISVTPATATVHKGSTQQFAATGTYSDGSTADLTAAVNWSAASGASINRQGLATGTNVAAAAITASSELIHGSATLIVTPAAMVSISVTPAAATIARGTTQQFSALGVYSDGSTQDLSASATWSASAGATVTSTGLARGTAVATATVTASAALISNTAALSVILPAIRSIAAQPSGVSLGIGGHQQYTAIATYMDGIQADLTSSVVWHSGTPSVVAFAGSGLANVVSTSASPVLITATAGAVISNTVSLNALASLPRVCDSPTIDLKLLVITNGKSEADFAAITQILDYVGTPYTVFDMASRPGGITSTFLSDGQCHAFYQGVIFTLGDYVASLPGMATLSSYEQTFRVRQVNWYTFPTSTFGFNPVSAGSGDPVTASFTPAAAGVFSQINTTTPLSISGAWTYLATPGTPVQGAVTPLLTDSAGNALSVIYAMGDGREYLTQTFDSNSQLRHGLILAYGLINWVTKGIFLGEYHVYSVPQVDDVFMKNDEWTSTASCPNSAALPQFRLTGDDVAATVSWQDLKHQSSLFTDFTLHLAFVGAGATGDPAQGGFRPDTLTPALLQQKSNFKWISHTWSHPNLDTATAAVAHSEITQNNAEATVLGLPGYNAASLVSPQISGLNNPDFVNQAVADGLRYVVSDTSVIGQPNNGPNPSPNVGIVSTINPLLYEVPRHATNLFYNVSTPEDWTAEYQCIFAGQAPYDTFTYDDIRQNVSQTMLTNMLRGDMDPLMFHMSNLHAYDGVHSILGDLLDDTLNTYTSLLKLPVLSPTLDQLALSMQARAEYNRSAVSASLISTSIQITVPSGSPVSSVTIPVTGLVSPGAEDYAGQKISHIHVNQGQTVTLPLP